MHPLFACPRTIYAGEAACEAALLLVALDYVRVPRLRRVRIFAGFAESTPLAKQVPALVERDGEELDAGE